MWYSVGFNPLLLLTYYISPVFSFSLVLAIVLLKSWIVMVGWGNNLLQVPPSSCNSIVKLLYKSYTFEPHGRKTYTNSKLVSLLMSYICYWCLPYLYLNCLFGSCVKLKDVESDVFKSKDNDVADRDEVFGVLNSLKVGSPLPILDVHYVHKIWKCLFMNYYSLLLL